MTWWNNPHLTDILGAGYLGVLTLAWILMVFGINRWGDDWFVPLPEGAPPKEGPWLSICIPARNEALNIAACVQAALKTNWPRLEVVLVDDRSDDGTGEVARAAAGGDPRLRVVEGVEPQPGWAGKPWACMRAAQEARGAWLLFVDADVILHPDAARAALGVATRRDLALLSFFGTWTLQSFWERTLIPAVGWLIRGSIDFNKVNLRSSPTGFANGQFMLFRRSSYASLEGHACVRDQVLEDVRIAEVVKRSGFGCEIRPAPWSFHVRLYRNLGEIVNGYTKNMYEGMGRNPIMGLAAALFIFIGTLLPFLLLGFGLFTRSIWEWGLPSPAWLVWLGGICTLQFAFRWRIEKRDGRSGSMAWSHPLANALLLLIMLRSTVKVKVKWKGREFVDGRAAS
jgi:chlorobactene glucosyltransferase